MDLVLRRDEWSLPVEVKYRERPRLEPDGGLAAYCRARRPALAVLATRRDRDLRRGAAGRRADPRAEDSGAYPLLSAGPRGTAERRRFRGAGRRLTGLAGEGRDFRAPPESRMYLAQPA